MTEEQPPLPPEPPLEAPPPDVEPERYPFWGYSDLFLFAGLTIPAMLIGVAAVKALLFVTNIHLIRVAELLTEQFAGYAVLALVLVMIFRLQYGRPFWSSLAWNPVRIAPVWVMLAGVSAALFVAVAGYFIKAPTSANPMTELLQDRRSIILVTLFGVTWGPLAEELAFRGFLQPLLEKSFGAFLGIIGAAIPFGLLHFWEYGNSWRHAFLIAAAGAAFGWMRHATNSTRASTLMHAAYNALFFLTLLREHPL
jgi:membrane protease YdiL (CAAX protease family)